MTRSCKLISKNFDYFSNAEGHAPALPQHEKHSEHNLLFRIFTYKFRVEGHIFTLLNGILSHNKIF